MDRFVAIYGAFKSNLLVKDLMTNPNLHISLEWTHLDEDVLVFKSPQWDGVIEATLRTTYPYGISYAVPHTDEFRIALREHGASPYECEYHHTCLLLWQGNTPSERGQYAVIALGSIDDRVPDSIRNLLQANFCVTCSKQGYGPKWYKKHLTCTNCKGYVCPHVMDTCSSNSEPHYHDCIN